MRRDEHVPRYIYYIHTKKDNTAAVDSSRTHTHTHTHLLKLTLSIFFTHTHTYCGFIYYRSADVLVLVCAVLYTHNLSHTHTHILLLTPPSTVRFSLSLSRPLYISFARDPRACVYKSVWLRFNNLYQFAFRSLIINFYFFSLFSPPPDSTAVGLLLVVLSLSLSHSIGVR